MRPSHIIYLLLLAASIAWSGPVEHPDPAPDAHISYADRLARVAYRPSWAPIPLIRGEAAGAAGVCQALESTDADAIARTAFLLGQIEYRDCARQLSRLLVHPDRDVRVHAGIALACMGDRRGMATCAAALGDAPTWVKYYAIYGLWRINSRDSRRALYNPTEKNAFIRRIARLAIETPFTVPPALPRTRLKPGAELPSPEDVWKEASQVYVTEGDWWWHQGDYEQCIRCLEVAVFLDPTYADGYSSIAWLQWSLGRDAQAIGTLYRGVKAVPSDPTPYFELGMHYFRTKRYALALKPLRDSVALGGDHRSRRTYAHCLERVGKLQEAVEQWEAIVAADPSDGAAKQNLERLRAALSTGIQPR